MNALRDFKMTRETTQQKKPTLKPMGCEKPERTPETSTKKEHCLNLNQQALKSEIEDKCSKDL